MNITIAAADLVDAIVGNNPMAVRGNLVDLGFVSEAYNLTSAGFMDLLTKIPVNSRSEALEIVSDALDVPLENNGFGAQYLWQQLSMYQMSLKEFVYQVFDQQLPKMTQNYRHTCNCQKDAFPYSKEQTIILILAAFGGLFLLVLLFKMIFKILD